MRVAVQAAGVQQHGEVRVEGHAAEARHVVRVRLVQPA
jgi:hypothetical protein